MSTRPMSATFSHCSLCQCPLPAGAQLNVCARCAFTAASAGGAALPQIEGCEILALAGEGGMGRVYRARQHAAGGRTVAVKILPPGALSPQADERFAREAALLARLAHPQVAAVYGAGFTDDGDRYLMMEWIEGRPLPDAVRGAELPAAATVALMAKACDGVQAAHAINIVHRDLKPANLFADAAAGSVKVLDFGLALDLEELRQLSLSGAVMGTPDYMAPEQVRSEPCGPATDVFALGVVLHLCLTGRHPFPARTFSQRMHLSADDALPALDSSVPRDLRAILSKALDPVRARRYRTAGEFAEDLRRWLEGKPVHARAPGALYYAGRFLSRHRAASGAAVLVLGGAAAAAAWHLDTRAEAERALRGQFADTLLVSAELHGQRGQWEPALEEIERAAQAGARDPARAALAKIEALVAAGRRDAALSAVQSLTGATLPHPGLADYWRAQLIDGSAGIEEATGYLRRAEEAGLPPVLRLISAALLGEDEAETEAMLLEAVQLEPWNHQALLLHAFALAFTGRDAEARAAATAAARLFPRSRDLAFCTRFLEARTGGTPGDSDDPLIADMHFLQQQRAGIYDMAWQRGENALTRVLKARSILKRASAALLLTGRDVAGAAGNAVSSLVLRFIMRLHERELRSVQLLHEKPQNLPALQEMLKAENRRAHPSVTVITHCASALLTPALSNDKLSALIESVCGRMAAAPGILDAERALMLEMCVTQTLFRVPSSGDPELRRRSVDYVRRRLAVPVPCAAVPARVLSQGMVACEDIPLARSCALAARTDAPGDPESVLQQLAVEHKARQWQRCMELAAELPAHASEEQQQRADGMKAGALRELRGLVEREP